MQNIRERLLEIRRRIQSKLVGNTAHALLDETATNDEYRIWADIAYLLETPADRFASEAFMTLLHRRPERDELIRVEKLLAGPRQCRAGILFELCSSEEAGSMGLWPVAALLYRMLHRLKPAWKTDYLDAVEGEDFVRALFQTVLGEPIGDGFSLWLDLLNKGLITKEAMIRLFVALGAT